MNRFYPSQTKKDSITFYQYRKLLFNMYNTGNMISLLCLPRTAYFSYYQLGVYMKHRDFLEARTQTLNEIISYLVLSYANTF